jgi:hypothetical protein
MARKLKIFSEVGRRAAMKKWILIGGAVVLAVLVTLVIGIINIGPLIKRAVNTYGPGITKTDVRLDDVSLSIFAGGAKLKGFYLGNPRGFKSSEALKAGSIFLEVDRDSLRKDTIVIEKIEVVHPEITYERARGTDNFQTILDNVTKTVGSGEAPKGKSPEGGTGRKLLIRSVLLKEGKVTLAGSFMGDSSIGVPLPDLHLKNIGGKEGVSPAKAFKEIFTALHEKITSPTIANQLNERLKAAGEGAKKQLETAGKGVRE